MTYAASGVPPMLLRSPGARRRLAGTLIATTLLCGCSGGDPVPPTPPPAPVITPPAELIVQRGLAACYVSQHPATDIPTVKSYRLTATTPLPEGITPSVKSVRFAGKDGRSE